MNEPAALHFHRSMLWAAYGDALGFITELADESGVKNRSGVKHVTSTGQWSRRIGGKFGAAVSLPAGTYSDDTQLRLSTARSIRGDGTFDVEAFSKVELPVWLNYALGAGRATKVAAGSLTKEGASWFLNFFEDGPVSYIESGGNGAAMRIQPHALASRNPEAFTEVLLDVFRNSICTHGHPRAHVGALFHALSLLYVRRNRCMPAPNTWIDIAESLRVVPEVITKDNDIRDFWLPNWERIAAVRFSAAFNSVVDEVRDLIDRVIQSMESDARDIYISSLEILDARNPNHRGSGTITALLANVLAFSEADPSRAMEKAANALGTDTDSICTMAGALLGLIAQDVPRHHVQDREYIEHEAERLFNLSRGVKASAFPYPDPLGWQAPKAPLDAVGLLEGQLHLSGLGSLVPHGEVVETKGKAPTLLQWAKLDFGQTLLIKRRTKLEPLPPYSAGVARISHNPKPPPRQEALDLRLGGARKIDTPPPLTNKSMRHERSIDELTKEAIRSDFRPDVMGTHLLELAEMENAIELSVAYSAIISKALISRKKVTRK